MPVRPKKPCAKPGCPQLVEAGQRHCEQHKRQEQKRYDEQRGTATERGYTGRWARYSKQYRMQHPLCVMCLKEDRLTPSEHVDHINPVAGPQDSRFWDPSNHQALCRTCHSRKTAREDGGFGRN